MQRKIFPLLLIVLVFAGPYLLRRWESTLRGDALTYAAVAKTMYQSGDWCHPHIGQRPYLNKPPLLFWLSAVSMHLFGADGYGGSVVPIFCTLVLALCMYAFLAALRQEREALWTALLLLVTRGFIRNAALRMDPLLCALIAFSVLSAVLARRKPIFLSMVGIAFGLGILTKSLAGLWVLIAGGLAALCLGPPRAFLKPWWWIGLVVGVAVAAPWHLAMSERFGETFWRVYIRREIWHRIHPNAADFPSHSASVYLSHFVKNFLPTLPLLAGAAAWGVRRKLHIPPKLGLFLALWTAVGIILPLVPKTKYARYLLPLYLPLTVYASFFVTRIFPQEKELALKKALCVCTAGLWLLLSCIPVRLHSPDKLEVRKVIPLLRACVEKGYTVYLHKYKFQRIEASLIVYGDIVPSRLPEGAEFARIGKALLFSRQYLPAGVLLADCSNYKLYLFSPQARVPATAQRRAHS